MFIMSPWNKTISYGETMRAEMRARESALKNFFQNVDVAIREGSREESSTSGKWQVGMEMRAGSGCRAVSCSVHACALTPWQRGKRTAQQAPAANSRWV
jgi:hypothetical protein